MSERRGVETAYEFGGYCFAVLFDSGALAGLDQLDIRYSEGGADPAAAGRHLRSFYYDDIEEHHMRNFCAKFAADPDYRAVCLEGRADWAVRDALFLRNAAPEYWLDPTLVSQLGDRRAVYHFVRRNWKAVVSLPEYARLRALDGRCRCRRGAPDAEMAEAAAAFRSLAGASVRAACRGVSGVVEFEGRRVLPVGEHSERAHVIFDRLSDEAEGRLMEAAVKDAALVYFPSLRRLAATPGANERFRRRAAELARSIAHRPSSPCRALAGGAADTGPLRRPA